MRLLDILICTLESRRAMFDALYAKLLGQIERAGLTDAVGVRFLRDNKEISLGEKRNRMLRDSDAEYTCFVDDDDDVADDYVAVIVNALKSKPDCVSLMGLITFGGINQRVFIHSLAFQDYFEHNQIYYRPPNHLNPMRREVAVQIEIEKKNGGQDDEWALEICRAGLLKTEAVVDKPYYFYKFDPYTSETQRMDVKWKSQIGQDKWAFETLKCKRNGYFVDVGAADGVDMSNTYVLEKEFGWTGIAVEAHGAMFQSLAANRSCNCVHACVMGDVREVEFQEAGFLSGAKEGFNAPTLERLKIEGVADGPIVKMTSRTLADILDEHGAPAVIDFLSMDTEGSESAILGAFPFDRYSFRAICVEHNGFPEPMAKQRAILSGHGYTLVVAGVQDDYWIGPVGRCVS